MKLHKAYGNFILECQRRGIDLYDFNKNYFYARELAHYPIMWGRETANGFNYWNEIEILFKIHLKDFYNKDLLDKTKAILDETNMLSPNYFRLKDNITKKRLR